MMRFQMFEGHSTGSRHIKALVSSPLLIQHSILDILCTQCRWIISGRAFLSASSPFRGFQLSHDEAETNLC